MLGCLSVADKKWNNTKERVDTVTSDYFGGNVPAGFEVHSHELLSPNGGEFFTGPRLVTGLAFHVRYLV